MLAVADLPPAQLAQVALMDSAHPGDHRSQRSGAPFWYARKYLAAWKSARDTGLLSARSDRRSGPKTLFTLAG